MRSDRATKEHITGAAGALGNYRAAGLKQKAAQAACFHRSTSSEKPHPLVEAESNRFKRDQAGPQGGIHPCGSAQPWDMVPAPAAQPEAVLCLPQAPATSHRARGTWVHPSTATCLFLFTGRMNELFHSPAQFGTDAREILTRLQNKLRAALGNHAWRSGRGLRWRAGRIQIDAAHISAEHKKP